MTLSRVSLKTHSCPRNWSSSSLLSSFRKKFFHFPGNLAWLDTLLDWSRINVFCKKPHTLRVFFIINLLCFMGNVQVNWPTLLQVFSVTFTLICSCMRSFNHSTSARVKQYIHIDANFLLLEHFEKSVKLIIVHVIPPSRRNRHNIAHRSPLCFVILSRSNCSKSPKFSSICLFLYMC